MAPSTLRVRVLRSVTEVGPEVWDALCGDDPVFCYGWFRALEESGVAQVEPRHLILEAHGRVVGILPCFIQRGDPYFTLQERLFGPLASLAHGLGVRALPALVASSPVGHKTSLLLAPGVDIGAAMQVCLRAMDDLVRQERLRASAWLFVPGEAPRLADALTRGGYRACLLAVQGIWHNRFESFEAYLKGFKAISRHHYRNIRYELNRLARTGVSLREEPLGAVPSAELAALRAVHYGRYHPGRVSPFSPAFFAALERHLGPRAAVDTAYRDGALVNYSLRLKGAGGWQMVFDGHADHPHSHADFLYFNLSYYHPFRLAIEQGVPQVDCGLGASETKVSRGCELKARFLWIRAHRQPLRLWLSLWLPLLDRHTRRKFAHLPLPPLGTTGEVAERPGAGAPWWRRVLRVMAERHTFVLAAVKTDWLAPEPPQPTGLDPVIAPRPSAVGGMVKQEQVGGRDVAPIGAGVQVPRAPRPAWYDRRGGLPVGLHIRPLREEELALLRPTVEPHLWALFERFRQAGYRCYGAWEDGTLLAYQWIVAGHPHLSEFFGEIPLQADEAFTGYIYAWPSARGRGVAHALTRRIIDDLAAEGIRVVYAGIANRNLASLKSLARFGMVPVCLRRYWRIGPFVWRRSLTLRPRHAIVELFVRERQQAGLPAQMPAHGPQDPRWRRNPAIAPRPSAVGGTVEQEHSGGRDVAPIGAGVQVPRAVPVGLHGSHEASQGSAPSEPVWRQALAIWRDHGPRRLALLALRRLVHLVWESEQTLEVRMPIDGMGQVRLPRRVTAPHVRRLGSGELEHLAPVTSAAMYRRFEAFWRQGFRCYVATVNGRVVGYNWYTDRPYHSALTRMTFDVPPGEVFLVYSHTLRPWRGKGIDVALKLTALAEFRWEGVRALRSTIDLSNRASWRNVKRWGAEPVRAYRYRRLLGWRRIEGPLEPNEILNGGRKPC